MTIFQSITVAACLACGLAGGRAGAQEVRDCARARIRISSVPGLLEYGVAANPGPRIETPKGAKRKDKTVGVVAVGPVIDAMVSPKVEAHLECTAGGARLIVTLVRSEHYGEATGENQLWRPQIKVDVTVRGLGDMQLRTTWKIRQAGSGEEVSRSRTVPYAEQRYPMSVTRTIKSAE